MGPVARATRLTGGGIYAVLALALGVATFIPEFRSLHNLGNVATQSAALGILAGFVLATTLLTVSWLSDTSDAEAWAHAVPSPMLAAASFEPS